jgi:hypothetical protein
MFKYFLVITIFIFPLLAKECYWNKKKHICLKRFYNIEEVRKYKSSEKYYLNPRTDLIFTVDDRITLKLKYKGAILYILENFPVEFFDKKNYNTYVLKVKDTENIFSIVTNLNHLSSVKLAKPYMERRYRKSFNRVDAIGDSKIEAEMMQEEEKKPKRAVGGKNTQGFKFGG